MNDRMRDEISRAGRSPFFVAKVTATDTVAGTLTVQRNERAGEVYTLPATFGSPPVGSLVFVMLNGDEPIVFGQIDGGGGLLGASQPAYFIGTWATPYTVFSGAQSNVNFGTDLYATHAREIEVHPSGFGVILPRPGLYEFTGEFKVGAASGAFDTNNHFEYTPMSGPAPGYGHYLGSLSEAIGAGDEIPFSVSCRAYIPFPNNLYGPVVVRSAGPDDKVFDPHYFSVVEVPNSAD